MTWLDAERRDRKLARLKLELEDEQVKFLEEPAGASEPGIRDLSEGVLQELLYAMYPPVHEGRKPGYGCFIASSDQVLARFASLGTVVGPTGDVGGDELRRLADGNSSFLVSTFAGTFVVHLPLATEVALVRVASETGCYGVVRSADGVVRLFGRSKLHIHEDGEWTVKPYAHTRVSALAQIIGSTTSSVAAALLDVCLHLLSPRHVGATLVWTVDGSSVDLSERLSRQGAPIGVAINLTNSADAEVLAAVLASVDGACLVDPDGSAVAVEAHLGATATAVDLIPPEHGTRHTSARRFSFDVPSCVVFVVSQDGPVTVFSDGVSVLHLEGLGSYAAAVGERVPAIAGVVQTQEDQARCSVCGKLIALEITLVPGWDEVDEVTCPVCDSPGLAEVRALEVRAWPKKAWS